MNCKMNQLGNIWLTWSYSAGVSGCSSKFVNKLQDKALLKPVSLSARMLRHFSQVRLFATPWTIACQAPLSMGFFRQEYWSGLPCPPPGGLPDPGIQPASLMSPALAGSFFTTRATWEAQVWVGSGQLCSVAPLGSRPGHSFPSSLHTSSQPPARFSLHSRMGNRMWLLWSPFSVVPGCGTQAFSFGFFMPIPIGNKRRRKMRARTKMVSCVVFLLGVNRFSEPFNLAFFLDTPKMCLGN